MSDFFTGIVSFLTGIASAVEFVAMVFAFFGGALFEAIGPLLAIAVTLLLLWRTVHRFRTHPGRGRFLPLRPIPVLLVLGVLAIDATAIEMVRYRYHLEYANYEAIKQTREWERQFLPASIQYGQLRIPAGSLVNFSYPTNDTLLTARIRFASPMPVAGVTATALDVTNDKVAMLELANDQRIGDVQCHRGKLAVFSIPTRYQVRKNGEFVHSEPFDFSKWHFEQCSDAPGIDVKLPKPPPPEPSLWSQLLPRRAAGTGFGG